MSNQLRDKWNAQYSTNNLRSSPTEILSENLYLLPNDGLALDLACGLGANSLLLAKQGMTVQAWDISDVACQKLQDQADTEALAIKTFTQEIDVSCFTPARFDVIVVSRFLDRSVCNAIMESLKPEGLLFYQTYTLQKINQQGPRTPRFLLAEHELLTLFSSLKTIFYRENGCLGNKTQGLRNEAQLIGQKR